MQLEAISGGRAFGIDYHLQVLFHPLPVGWMRTILQYLIRGVFRTKSRLLYLYLRLKRKMSPAAARELAGLYYKVECLRQSNGFSFVIRKR